MTIFLTLTVAAATAVSFVLMNILARRQRHLEPGGWTRRLDERLDNQLTFRYLERVLLTVIPATLMLLMVHIAPALTLGIAISGAIGLRALGLRRM